MNSLSVLIYAIGVADSARDIAITALIIVGIVGVGGAVLFPLVMMAAEDFDTDPKKVMRKARNWIVPIAIISILVIVFIPSRQTLLLIAGSEIGQRVIASEDAKSVIEPGAELLRTWIAEETRRLKGRKEP